jgi:type I restriction enzyme M protein
MGNAKMIEINYPLNYPLNHETNNKFRDRSGEILFIDARNMGEMIDRRHRELTDEEIKKISGTYHAWRGEDGKYEDVPGFCKSATPEEVRKQEHILTPGRDVGFPEEEDDGEPFEEKMKRFTSELAEQFEKSEKLEGAIKKNLGGLGYEF